MPEFSYFWDGLTVGDAILSPYNADELAGVLKAMTGSGASPFKSGVFIDELDDFSLAFGANVIGVDSGRAQVFGTSYLNTERQHIAIPSASATFRQDRLLLRKDWFSKTVRVTRIAGTEGVVLGTPTPNVGYVNTEGVLWDMPLWTISVNTAGTVVTVTDDRVYLPYLSDLALGTLPGVTSIPNLVLSEYTKDLITILDNLATAPALVSAPVLNLSSATENQIITLLNLAIAPALNYSGLVGLVPPMCSLTLSTPGATVPPNGTNDVHTFNVRRIDTTNGIMWSPTVNPSRITCALGGLYEVSAVKGMQGIPGSDVLLVLKIRKNGTTELARAEINVRDSTIGGASHTACILSPTIIKLISGDYIELVTDHVAAPAPVWSGSMENYFTLKYVGALTVNCIGTII